jgi:predicted phosphoribosyltransferase
VPIRHAALYSDRTDAGKRLVPLLSQHKGTAAIVFALPRGGVPVAIEVARALALPLDLLYVRKIGVPWQPELALGAVVDGADPDIVVNDRVAEQLDVSRDEIDARGRQELQEIARRKRAYGDVLGVPVMPTGRVVIVVDDGVATGADMRAAVQALRRRGAVRVIVAVPVAPPDAVVALEKAGAEVVCPHVTEDFAGVGAFYREFGQLSDEDVVALLRAFRTETGCDKAETLRSERQGDAPNAAS